MPQDSVEEKQLLDGIDFARLPRHVAVIMDGNGRWAKKRMMPRIEGHRAGIASVRETVETSARLGLKVLTLYAFSVENWKRPELEISGLMLLLKHYLRSELDTMLKNDIRFGVIGRPEALPADVQDELARATERTRHSQGLLFQLALNYGGRTELADGVRRLAADVQANGLDPATIDETTLARYLYTAGQPDPDLLIRTSGELRVSNFLLWQIAYSEIWVTDVLWPDFRRRHLLQAVVDYQRRERRYGGIVAS
ncbi:MAG: isoprenyl transferase [Vicinamibacteria bacterium]|nr:isoprenyl transferase [Vicinamibacteria bacterium]